MTETLLSLVPDYGLWFVALIVLLGCLGIPLPGSILVVSAGAFSASGDLVLWQAFAMAYIAYVVGDQVVFHLSHNGGQRLLKMRAKSQRIEKLMRRAELLVERWGMAAILISRAIITPIAPYVAYIAGASGLKWRWFTAASLPGAAAWTGLYLGLGYAFASQLGQLTTLVANGSVFVLLSALTGAIGWWLLRSWYRYRRNPARGSA